MASFAVQRPAVVHSSRSSFAGVTAAFSRLSVSRQASGRQLAVSVECGKKCQLTGAKANKANTVTFSAKKNRKWQEVNLHYKKVYWESAKRMVKLRISTRAMKTLNKKGLEAMAKEQGIDLWSLPFEDCSPARREYLAKREEITPPTNKTISPTGVRRMTNPERLAASKKLPLVAKYDFGRIYFTRAESAPSQ